MQRVCKYELLIKNVIHQEKKREKPDTDSIKILTNVMKRLNSTLQLIDKRRNEVCILFIYLIKFIIIFILYYLV